MTGHGSTSRTDNLLHGNGPLSIHPWASDLGVSSHQQLLGIDLREQPTHIVHSNATGRSLVSNGLIGADLLHIGAGDGFVPHIHSGHHLLIVVGGLGTITYAGIVYPTRAGDLYMVEGNVPHAVGAITDHTILAVGSPHTPVDSTDRMIPVAYETLTESLSDSLHCSICRVSSKSPRRLHDLGCPHCPCAECRYLR